MPRGMERGTKKAKYGDFLASFLASIQIIICSTNMQTRICRFHRCKYGLLTNKNVVILYVYLHIGTTKSCFSAKKERE